MQRRLVTNGFGANAPVLLDNKGAITINKEFADAALAAYFEKEKGFDVHVADDHVDIGIEPTYQHDNLKLISINKDKAKSYIRRGTSMGPYGSQILDKTKTYGEYKRKCKFTKFVDRWHEVLFGKV